MYVHTSQAAKLLNIPRRRLLGLLQKGRVIGAYKSDRYWLIPLIDDLPQIVPGKRGRKGQWETKKPQTKRTVVHINKIHIQQNNKSTAQNHKPVISVKTYNGSEIPHKGYQGKAIENVYVQALEIPYPCRVVYQPDNPLSCGAKVWIEVMGDDLISLQPSGNLALVTS